jgi:hypothetical protein
MVTLHDCRACRGVDLESGIPLWVFCYQGSSPSGDVSACLSLFTIFVYFFIFSLLVFYFYFLRFNILCLLISLDLENHECLGTRDTVLKYNAYSVLLLGIVNWTDDPKRKHITCTEYIIRYGGVLLYCQPPHYIPARTCVETSQYTYVHASTCIPERGPVRRQMRGSHSQGNNCVLDIEMS